MLILSCHIVVGPGGRQEPEYVPGSEASPCRGYPALATEVLKPEVSGNLFHIREVPRQDPEMAKLAKEILPFSK
eukprot:2105080-Amphidinium_carterae.1